MKMSQETIPYHREYRVKNKERINAYQRERRKKLHKTEAYRARKREDMRKYRLKNPEKVRERNKKWREKCRANNGGRLHTYPKPISRNKFSLRFKIFMRDNFTCTYCGRNPKEDGVKLELDHIFPRSKGGKDTFDNYSTACKDCNIGKLNKIL